MNFCPSKRVFIQIYFVFLLPEHDEHYIKKKIVCIQALSHSNDEIR